MKAERLAKRRRDATPLDSPLERWVRRLLAKTTYLIGWEKHGLAVIANWVLTRRPIDRADGDQIGVLDVANVVLRERNQSLGATRGSHEFNLEPVRAVNLDDCSEIASA
jgi:hypothetical protein